MHEQRSAHVKESEKGFVLHRQGRVLWQSAKKNPWNTRLVQISSIALRFQKGRLSGVGSPTAKSRRFDLGGTRPVQLTTLEVLARAVAFSTNVGPFENDSLTIK
eukprot:c966_g1_i1.p2 GENE.c966_g1_i1~~c966_g1_i1.p2  ORF type:complete len:104 (-),score=10.30 c966_g1_i1:210-521(-)